MSFDVEKKFVFSVFKEFKMRKNKVNIIFYIIVDFVDYYLLFNYDEVV